MVKIFQCPSIVKLTKKKTKQFIIGVHRYTYICITHISATKVTNEYCDCSFLYFQMATTNGYANHNDMSNGINGSTNGDMNEELTPRQRTKMSGVGLDGYPRLPPIQKSKRADDPYANSKLMTFRLANHKQALLMKIL